MASADDPDPIRRRFPFLRSRDFAPRTIGNEVDQPTYWLVQVRLALVVLLITAVVVAAIVINA